MGDNYTGVSGRTIESAIAAAWDKWGNSIDITTREAI
jgi:hypothetical protein